jgi:hypothetical protein
VGGRQLVRVVLAQGKGEEVGPGPVVSV